LSLGLRGLALIYVVLRHFWPLSWCGWFIPNTRSPNPPSPSCCSPLQCVPLSLNAYSDTLARRWRISMARIFLKSSGPKPSPFGAPDFTPLVARVCLTPLSERSTAKLQALTWRPSGSGHRICQRADDSGIAIPSTTELLWPALKFQDFLRLSRGRDHYFTTSLWKRTKSPQLSRGKLEDY